MVDWLNASLWVAQGVLALLFLFAGTTKALRYAKAREMMAWTRDVPENLVRFIGTAETLGAIGIVLPQLVDILPLLTPMAAMGLAAIMVLAAGFHANRLRSGTHDAKVEGQSLASNVVILALAAFVAWGRWELIG